MGIKIYVGESNRFPLKITYEEITERVKKGKYKMTYTEKKIRVGRKR